jgi:hypothetical protein
MDAKATRKPSGSDLTNEEWPILALEWPPPVWMLRRLAKGSPLQACPC